MTEPYPLPYFTRAIFSAMRPVKAEPSVPSLTRRGIGASEAAWCLRQAAARHLQICDTYLSAAIAAGVLWHRHELPRIVAAAGLLPDGATVEWEHHAVLQPADGHVLGYAWASRAPLEVHLDALITLPDGKRLIVEGKTSYSTEGIYVPAYITQCAIYQLYAERKLHAQADVVILVEHVPSGEVRKVRLQAGAFRRPMPWTGGRSVRDWAMERANSIAAAYELAALTAAPAIVDESTEMSWMCRTCRVVQCPHHWQHRRWLAAEQKAGRVTTTGTTAATATVTWEGPHGPIVIGGAPP